MLGICMDVTSRRLTEEALRYSEDRYRSLVELSPDAVFVNRNNRIVFVNQAAVHLFVRRRSTNWWERIRSSSDSRSITPHSVRERALSLRLKQRRSWKGKSSAWTAPL
jgi:PAS domain-containing protein